jgi:hypothetical protein
MECYCVFSELETAFLNMIYINFRLHTAETDYRNIEYECVHWFQLFQDNVWYINQLQNNAQHIYLNLRFET